MDHIESLNILFIKTLYISELNLVKLINLISKFNKLYPTDIIGY